MTVDDKKDILLGMGSFLLILLYPAIKYLLKMEPDGIILAISSAGAAHLYGAVLSPIVNSLLTRKESPK